MLARGMHRTTDAARSHSWAGGRTRTVGRPAGSTRSLRTRPLKNRLAALHAAQRLRRSRRRGINGARSRLGHYHALDVCPCKCRHARRDRRLGGRARVGPGGGTGSHRRLGHRRWHRCWSRSRGCGLRHSRPCWSRRGCGRNCRLCLLWGTFRRDCDSRRCPFQAGCGRFHNHRARRRARGDGRRRCWCRRNYLRSLSRQRDYSSRSGLRSRGGVGRHRARGRASGSRRADCGSRCRRCGRARENGRRLWPCGCSGHGGSRRCGHATMHTLRFALLFLLLNGPQNISGPGNLGQIDLRLRLRRSGPAGRARRRLAPAAQGGAHTPGFVFLHRAGVRLLFRHSHFREYVEYHSALDFQLSR